MKGEASSPAGCPEDAPFSALGEAGRSCSPEGRLSSGRRATLAGQGGMGQVSASPRGGFMGDS